MIETSMRIKKAGGGNPPATTSTPAVYNSQSRRVKTRRQIFPGRRPPQPPAGSCHAAALGLLVGLFALQGCSLPAKDRRPAVMLAERWAREIIDARHPTEAA